MPKWVVFVAGIFFVSWFVFLVICFASSLSDFVHQKDEKNNVKVDYKQLTRIDLTMKNIEKDLFEEEVIISHRDLINELIPIWADIEWDDKKVSSKRAPDAMVHAFFTTDKNLPEKIIVYYIWFDAVDGKTMIQNSENNAIGWVVDKDNTNMKRILLEQVISSKK